MTVGSTLKLLRTASNLTQRSLAEDLNVTANYLSLIENGRKEPSLTFLKKFSKRLEAPLGYLLWLALEEGKSPEERNLKSKMGELLVNIIRVKGDNSRINKDRDEEEA